jgi:hypothetical protein
MAKRAKTKPAQKTAKKKTAKKPAAKARAKAKPAKKAVRKAPTKKPAKPAAPAIVRQFRYTSADTVQIRLKGEKKPESFRVDDMSEASLAAQDGSSKHYYQFKLVSLDRQNADGSERSLWFFDPKPVGASDPLYPLLWQPVSDDVVAGEPVASHSGNFSTRSVTGYDGSGAVHVVKDDGAYRLRFDFNGKRTVCESLPVSIAKGDAISIS